MVFIIKKLIMLLLERNVIKNMLGTFKINRKEGFKKISPEQQQKNGSVG